MTIIDDIRKKRLPMKPSESSLMEMIMEPEPDLMAKIMEPIGTAVERFQQTFQPPGTRQPSLLEWLTSEPSLRALKGFAGWVGGAVAPELIGVEETGKPYAEAFEGFWKGITRPDEVPFLGAGGFFAPWRPTAFEPGLLTQIMEKHVPREEYPGIGGQIARHVIPNLIAAPVEVGLDLLVPSPVFQAMPKPAKKLVSKILTARLPMTGKVGKPVEWTAETLMKIGWGLPAEEAMEAIPKMGFDPAKMADLNLTETETKRMNILLKKTMKDLHPSDEIINEIINNKIAKGIIPTQDDMLNLMAARNIELGTISKYDNQVENYLIKEAGMGDSEARFIRQHINKIGVTSTDFMNAPAETLSSMTGDLPKYIEPELVDILKKGEIDVSPWGWITDTKAKLLDVHAKAIASGDEVAAVKMAQPLKAFMELERSSYAWAKELPGWEKRLDDVQRLVKDFEKIGGQEAKRILALSPETGHLTDELKKSAPEIYRLSKELLDDLYKLKPEGVAEADWIHYCEDYFPIKGNLANDLLVYKRTGKLPSWAKSRVDLEKAVARQSRGYMDLLKGRAYSGVKYYHMSQPTQKFEKLISKRDFPPTLKRMMQRNIANMTGTILPDEHIVIQPVQRFLKKFGYDITPYEARNIVRAFQDLSYSSVLSDPYLWGIKQPLQRLHGLMYMGFGDLAEGSMMARTAAGKRLADLYEIPQQAVTYTPGLRGKIMWGTKPFSWQDYGSRIRMVCGENKRVMRAGKKLIEGRIDDVTFLKQVGCGEEMGTHHLSIRSIAKSILEQDITIARRDWVSNFPKGVLKEFDELALTNPRQAKINAIAYLLADDTQYMTQFPYGSIHTPPALRGVTGRIGGQFNTWSIYFTKMNMAAVSNRNWAGLLRFYSTWLAMVAASGGVIKKWHPATSIKPMTAGPIAMAAYDSLQMSSHLLRDKIMPGEPTPWEKKAFYESLGRTKRFMWLLMPYGGPIKDLGTMIMESDLTAEEKLWIMMGLSGEKDKEKVAPLSDVKMRSELFKNRASKEMQSELF